MMRSAGNFSSEWGYLAPAPSFLRTARVVLVATAIGATAGAGVVLSLVDHPSAEGETTASARGACHRRDQRAGRADSGPVTPRSASRRDSGCGPSAAMTPAADCRACQR